MRYEMLLRTSEKSAVEAKIEASLAAEPPEATQLGPKSDIAVAAKEVRRLRTQTEGAKVVIAKVMEENVKIRTEIAEGTFPPGCLLSGLKLAEGWADWIWTLS